MECVAAIAAASEELRRAGGPAAAELSTTLVVALLSTGDQQGDAAAVARVGDSTAFTLSVEGEWEETFGGPGDGSELWSTATDVLPLNGDVDCVETASVGLAQGMALVLATDGVANPLRDGPTTVAPALASVLADGANGGLSPLALAHAADFSRRGALDDRTVLVAWVRPSAGTVVPRPV